MNDIDRRDFMKLAGLGGVVFASGLGFNAFGTNGGHEALKARMINQEDCYFVQLSDTQWCFDGPKVNPDAQGTLKKAVALVTSLNEQPDFVVFTGDLTHTTDDPKARRDRMAEFQEIVSKLKVKAVRFIAGEHDAA